MDRQAYERLVEQSYFGAMARGDVAGIMTLFAPDATVTTFYGDTPSRRMREVPREGDESLEGFFILRGYDVRYSEFEHVIDVEAQRIASKYTLHLASRTGTIGDKSSVRKFRNCNLFELKNGKIVKVTIYFANPPDVV